MGLFLCLHQRCVLNDDCDGLPAEGACDDCYTLVVRSWGGLEIFIGA